MSEDWLQANRAWWDEAAPLHAASAFYDLDGLVAGSDHIRPFEHDELGPVAGRTLCHLQCHIGTDTLSWARHGARVVGLDFSQPAIDAARRLAEACGLAAEFACADVYDAPAALGQQTLNYAISEVVTAVLRAGLQLELLGEQEVTNVPHAWLERGTDGLYRVKPGSPRYPLTYSIRARQPI